MGEEETPTWTSLTEWMLFVRENLREEMGYKQTDAIDTWLENHDVFVELL